MEPYSSLKPFQGLFRTGIPVLMYHKLGPRPRRARLKGLYVSERLFAEQLGELRATGYGPAMMGEVATAPGRDCMRVGITFDDGFSNVIRFGMHALVKTKFRATQFLVAGRLGGTNDWDVANGEAPESLMDQRQIEEWLAAGHEIGSHTMTHPWLTRIPIAQAREEIIASKKALEDLFGRPVKHFCYPYGDYNGAVRELVIEAGYETACTTEGGINSTGADRYAIKRLTARYPSRSFKAIWRRWFGKLEP